MAGDLDRFLRSRQDAWRRLEQAVSRIEKSGFSSLTPAQLKELGGLYRQASADLVYAESALQNADAAAYLNALVASAYATIYRRNRFSWDNVKAFFLSGFPALVRRHLRPIAASTALFLVSMGFAGAVVGRDLEAFYYVVPEPYWKVYGELAADHREARFGGSMSPDRAVQFSTMILTNNIRVCFNASVMGITGGILTAVAIFYNGALLGAIGASMHRFGQDLDFWGLIIPHAGIEMSCIFIAGGAGFVLGGGLLRPGRRSRFEAAREAGRDAVLLAAGVAPFLVIAGLIEGLVTPLAGIDPWMKIALGIATGAGFWWYLLRAGRSHARA